MKKLEFSNDIGFERLLDEATALLRVKVCSSRENAHDLYIEDDALIEASDSVLGKPIVAKYSPWTKDAMGHEETENPIGYVIDNQTPAFVKEKNGAVSLVVYAILWKEYVPEIFELFAKKKEFGEEPIKKVSMEIYLNDVAVDDEDNQRLRKFRFKGITLLGDSYTPACELAQAEMVAFATRAKQAEVLFSMNITQNKKKEKEEEMKIDNIEKSFEEPKGLEEDVMMAVPEEDQLKETPPTDSDLKEEDTEEKPETFEEEVIIEDDKDDDEVDYQAKYEELRAQFDAAQFEIAKLKEENEAFAAKFAEVAESEKSFAIEQVLLKFESKLSKEQVSEFKERAKEVKPEDANAFCNEIKAFVADIVCSTDEVVFTENRMEILTPAVENKKETQFFDWE